MQLQSIEQTPIRIGVDSDDLETLREQLQQLQTALRSYTEVQKTLEESEVRYRELFERIQTGIYRVSVDGKLLLANAALLRIFGFADINAAKSVESFYLKANGRRQFLEAIERAGEISGHEASYRRRDGSIVQVRESARAIRDNHGRTLYYEGLIEDLTHLRRSETLGRDSHYILQTLGENRPLGEVLSEVARMVARQWTGSVSLIFRTSDAPFIVADSGVSISTREMLQRQRNHSLCEAAVTGVPLTLTNLSNLPALSSEFASLWSVPVMSGEEALLGCLTVLHRFSRIAEQEEILSLQTAARLTALALEQQKMQNDLDHIANYDSVTELPNRRLLQERLEISLAYAQTHGHRVGLLFLDLDHFKVVNDQFGHRYGDTLLQMVAARLTEEAGRGLFLSRLGGDEFALLVPHMNDDHEAETLASRVVELCARPWNCIDQELIATASIGIAVFPDDAADAAGLQSHADSAMYQAKGRGRSTFQRYQKTQVSFLQRRIGLENSLRQALERNEFQLYYQPQVDAQTCLCGLEALIRWNHPQDGILGPAHFLPVAEESGLIVPIGDWVIDEAVRQLAAWRKHNGPSIPVSVNVSAMQLDRTWLPGIVEQKLRSYGLPANWLAIEITESLVMRNSDGATEQLKAIRKLGMQVAIDDFGTGYSSLSYLQQLPVDVLKIDRSFIKSLGRDDERANAVVRAIIGLARTFQLRVTAEGVETAEQHRELAELGVDTFQGYLFGRPMPADSIAPLLANLSRPLHS